MTYLKMQMLRALKKLFGLWEPREGVIYRNKYYINNVLYIRGKNTLIFVECSIDGNTWQPCTFKLEKGVYEVHIKDDPLHYKTVEEFKIHKKYVKVKKEKKWYEVYEQPDAGEVTEIHYRLYVKDPSKIIYIKKRHT